MNSPMIASGVRTKCRAPESVSPRRTKGTMSRICKGKAEWLMICITTWLRRKRRPASRQSRVVNPMNGRIAMAKLTVTAAETASGVAPWRSSATWLKPIFCSVYKQLRVDKTISDDQLKNVKVS